MQNCDETEFVGDFQINEQREEDSEIPNLAQDLQDFILNKGNEILDVLSNDHSDMFNGSFV